MGIRKEWISSFYIATPTPTYYLGWGTLWKYLSGKIRVRFGWETTLADIITRHQSLLAHAHNYNIIYNFLCLFIISCYCLLSLIIVYYLCLFIISCYCLLSLSVYCLILFLSVLRAESMVSGAGMFAVLALVCVCLAPRETSAQIFTQKEMWTGYSLYFYVFLTAILLPISVHEALGRNNLIKWVLLMPLYEPNEPKPEAILIFISFYVGGASLNIMIFFLWRRWGFFDNFDFFSYSDPTHGYVYYATHQEAFDWGFVNSTSKGQVRLFWEPFPFMLECIRLFIFYLYYIYVCNWILYDFFRVYSSLFRIFIRLRPDWLHIYTYIDLDIDIYC